MTENLFYFSRLLARGEEREQDRMAHAQGRASVLASHRGGRIIVVEEDDCLGWVL
jgi:hypothetical protein